MSSQALLLHAEPSGSVRSAVAALDDDVRVLGVVVFGSVARGEADNRSDVDILVVHSGKVPEELLDGMPDEVAISFYSPVRFAALPDRSPLFATHLAREGIVIRDRNESLSRLLGSMTPIDKITLGRLMGSTRRRFEDLSRHSREFRLNPATSAAELYALAKQAAMLAGAAEGEYEFNRRRALERSYLQTAFPVADRSRIDALEEPWYAVRAREGIIQSHDDLESAGAAVNRLLMALSE